MPERRKLPKVKDSIRQRVDALPNPEEGYRRLFELIETMEAEAR